jgi:hypothetical protein
LRVSFPHLSSRLKEAAIFQGYLWVKDTNGQVWRYLVGLDVIKDLLPERWKGVKKEELAKFGYSEACREAKCDIEKIPGWPAGQQETAR